jgi:hypothetical protein
MKITTRLQRCKAELVCYNRVLYLGHTLEDFVCCKTYFRRYDGHVTFGMKGIKTP